MKKILITALLTVLTASAFAAPKADVALHVEGRYLVNAKGEKVNLHGFAQAFDPYFNNGRWQGWDVKACLAYNQKCVDDLLAADWKMDFVRMHLDPHWSNDPEKPFVRYEGHEQFSEARFRKYLDEVFVPMVEFYAKRNLYVLMRPPGVCPGKMSVGDDYHRFLKKVWTIVASHPKIRNNPRVMFELANEPIEMSDGRGNFSNGWIRESNEQMTIFMQEVIDAIRATGSKHVIWVPGLNWQQSYAGYLEFPLKDDNYGFAIHCYPGWYGSDAERATDEVGGEVTQTGGYEKFRKGWDESPGKASKERPLIVTELDWAPAKYNASWGKGITGRPGKEGFGANFRKIADEDGNVSWLVFGDVERLARFEPDAARKSGDTFLTDHQACPWAVWHIFRHYAERRRQSKDQVSKAKGPRKTR